MIDRIMFNSVFCFNFYFYDRARNMFPQNESGGILRVFLACVNVWTSGERLCVRFKLELPLGPVAVKV